MRASVLPTSRGKLTSRLETILPTVHGKLLLTAAEIKTNCLLNKCKDGSSGPQNPWSPMPSHTSVIPPHICNPIASAVRWKAGMGKSWKLTSLGYATANNKDPALNKVGGRAYIRGYPLTSTCAIECLCSFPPTHEHTHPI